MKLRLFLTLSTLLFAGQALAKTCELDISANDQLQFDKKELTIAADCQQVKLTLTHTGKLAVAQMGHNWVVTETANLQAVAQEGMTQGLDKNYLVPDDKRVLAHTNMIGGGESISITFDVATLKKGGDYSFFCSFPGHWAVMKGKLIVE